MHVAIRDQTLYHAGYTDAVSGLRDLGLQSLELALSIDGIARSLVDDEKLDLTTGHGLAVLRKQTTLHGVRLCTLLCSQDFNSPELARHEEWVVTAVRVAEDLGVPAIRIDSAMTGQTELPLTDRVRLFSEAVVRVLRRTADSEVALGIENHGPQGNDPEWMDRVLRTVASPRLGLTFDLGNWYWWGHPLSRVYDLCERFAPLVRATHVKNIAYPPEVRETQREIGWEYGRYVSPLDEGDVDLARMAAILHRGGYEGPLTIEDESLGKFEGDARKAVLRRDVACLQAAIDQAGH